MNKFLAKSCLTCVLSVTILSTGLACETIYVGTMKGGLSVSEDGGASWHTDSSVLEGIQGNRTYGVFALGNTIFLANWGTGLSIGSPGNWRKIQQPKIPSNFLNGVFAVDNQIYVCSISGLFISKDGGLSWTSAKFGRGGVVVNRVIAAGNSIYVATNGFGLAISNDGGITWSSQLGVNGVLDVAISNGEVYVATIPDGSRVGGLYVSSDNFKHTTTLLAGSSLNSVAVDGQMVCVTDNFSVKISKDLGATWKSYLDNHPLFPHRVFAKDGVIYVATVNGIWISSDQGDTWLNSSIDDGLPDLSILDVFAQ